MGDAHTRTHERDHIATLCCRRRIIELTYSPAPISGSIRCPHRLDTSTHLCREGHPYRGLFHPRAAHPWCSGGGQPRRDWPRPLCRVRLGEARETLGTSTSHHQRQGGNERRKSSRSRRPVADLVANNSPRSDGIARVHGMANVQAEELVEYVNPQTTAPPTTLIDSYPGSPLASRACA